MARYAPTRTEQRRLIRHFAWKAQGEKCKICNQPQREDDGIVEHANGNPADYRPENIGFVCNSCNQRKRPDFVSNGPLPTGIDVCVNTSGPELIATAAALNRSSREMQISEREDLFRVFLWNNVGRKDELTVPEAIAEGAEYCDVSPATIEARWLPKATSRLSPFIVLPGTRGNSPTLIIKLRPRWKPVDNERGRKDRELMLLRQEREAQNIAKSLQEREAEVMDKEAAQRVAEHHKRDKFALIDALKAKGMSDDEITKILQDAANSQRGSQ